MFCKRRDEQGYDPLYKIRPFMESLLESFKSCYKLHKEVLVDESMIGFKGRLWFIQNMPNKPTKWEMKAFVLADSISAYTNSWQLYAVNDRVQKHIIYQIKPNIIRKNSKQTNINIRCMITKCNNNKYFILSFILFFFRER